MAGYATRVRADIARWREAGLIDPATAEALVRDVDSNERASLSFGSILAMMAALLGTMLPNVLLSGFIFPVESMPWLLRILSNVVPGRWFVAIARGIMLKGVGMTYLWRETLVLAAMALVLLAASARSFHTRLD